MEEVDGEYQRGLAVDGGCGVLTWREIKWLEREVKGSIMRGIEMK